MFMSYVVVSIMKPMFYRVKRENMIPATHPADLAAFLRHQGAWPHGHHVRKHASFQELYFYAPIPHLPVDLDRKNLINSDLNASLLPKWT